MFDWNKIVKLFSICCVKAICFWVDPIDTWRELKSTSTLNFDSKSKLVVSYLRLQKRLSRVVKSSQQFLGSLRWKHEIAIKTQIPLHPIIKFANYLFWLVCRQEYSRTLQRRHDVSSSHHRFTSLSPVCSAMCYNFTMHDWLSLSSYNLFALIYYFRYFLWCIFEHTKKTYKEESRFYFTSISDAITHPRYFCRSSSSA